MAAALSRLPVWLRAFPILLGACLAGCAAQEAKLPEDTRPQVLYLHTEFLPYESSADKDLSSRLNREIVRQALLIAARDGLGVQTCDETLEESPPDDAHVVDLILTERCSRDGKWHIKLCKFVKDEIVEGMKPVWEKTYDCNAAPEKIYADMIPKLEADSRGALVDALKTAGLHAEERTPIATTAEQAAPKTQPDVKAANDKKPPQPDAQKGDTPAATSVKAQKLLLMPDFVSQFGAVRAAHQAIHASGETPESLSVLARGYANLASLTHHHWSSTAEVFTARAWLYAQRMAAANASSSFALANRAYAWALGGSFQNAEADLDRLEKLPAPATPTAKASPAASAGKDASPDDHQWSKLTRAFISSNRADTKKVGDDINQLKPWATYLAFELANFDRHAKYMYEAANDVGPTCPMAYKVWDELAHHGQQLGVVRMGAAYAPSAFAHFLPLTLAALPNLPADVRELVPADHAKQTEVLKSLNDPNPNDEFSPLPGAVAEKLRDHSRHKLEGDLSWSALATLLEEEQFVEAANYMEVSTNATEAPLQNLFDALLPLVKKHRFANYIESFTLGGVRDPSRLFGYFGNMPVQDPRWNMWPMFSRIGYLKDGRGPICPRLMEEAGADFTLPGIVEMMFGGGSGAKITEPDVALRYANQARAIAPSSPIGTRLLVLFTPSPKPEDLAAWEKTAADDSITLLGLAQKYAKLDKKEAAIRCYEKSIAALPSVTAVTELAAFYHKQGDLKKWEETLTAFLKTPSLGLEHSVVQQQLAFGFAHAGEWSKARPFAVEAAETYSCSSLETGSYIAEGLGEWDLSEQLIRAAATNYPTGKGAEWYFWCRRTGRGEVKSAEQLAEKYFALPQPHPVEATYIVRGMWELLRGNVGPARDSFQQVLNLKRTFAYTCLVAQLSRELKDEATITEVFEAMEKNIQTPNPDVKRPPDVVAAGKLLMDLVKNGKPTAERVGAIEQAMLKFPEEHRQSAIGWCYIIGAELERAGNKKEAEKYYRRALIDCNRDQLLATLAGNKLAKLNGKSRPDKDPLEPKDLWPPRKAK